jgi:hypothetical protein
MRYLKHLFDRMMNVDHVNSRFVFLFNGSITGLAVLMLSIAFIAAKDKSGYPTMVMAVSGGGLGAAVGRFMTKKANTPPTEDGTNGSTGNP